MYFRVVRAVSALVSVIVPVYNLEKYIAASLGSICAQTYTELEILCVDDGSSDSSAQIIKAAAAEDGRIKYFRQENAGVSAARNRGLDEANGEYVLFVDGDDLLHPQAVQLLYGGAQKSGADMVCAQYSETDSLDVQPQKIASADFKEADFDYLFNCGKKIGKNIFCKLIKAQATENIRFQVGISIAEDGCYILKLLNEGIKTVATECELYYYCRREGSATKSGLDLRKMTALYAYDELCDYLAESENTAVRAYSLRCIYYRIIKNRKLYKGTEYEAQVKSDCKRIGNKHLKRYLAEKTVPLHVRIGHTVLFKFS